MVVKDLDAENVFMEQRKMLVASALCQRKRTAMSSNAVRGRPGVLLNDAVSAVESVRKIASGYASEDHQVNLDVKGFSKMSSHAMRALVHHGRLGANGARARLLAMVDFKKEYDPVLMAKSVWTGAEVKNQKFETVMLSNAIPRPESVTDLTWPSLLIQAAA